MSTHGPIFSILRRIHGANRYSGMSINSIYFALYSNDYAWQRNNEIIPRIVSVVKCAGVEEDPNYSATAWELPSNIGNSRDAAEKKCLVFNSMHQLTGECAYIRTTPASTRYTDTISEKSMYGQLYQNYAR